MLKHKDKPWSASKHKQWRTCPKKLDFRYWQGMMEEKTPALEFGSKFHEAMAEKLNTKKDSQDQEIRKLVDILSGTSQVQEQRFTEFEKFIEGEISGVPIRGYLDAVSDVWWDWKTHNGTYDLTEDVRTNPQTYIYYLMAGKGFYAYINKKAPHSVYIAKIGGISPDKVIGFKSELVKAHTLYKERMLPRKEGDHCRWCPYKNICLT